jgi:UrcA family protein
MKVVPSKSQSKLRTMAISAAVVGLFITLDCRAAAGAQIGADGYPAVTVSYGDLNLSTPEGALTLYRRIAKAANQVCGGNPDIRDPLAVRLSRLCRQAAMTRAVQAVGNARLAALLATGGGRS